MVKGVAVYSLTMEGPLGKAFKMSNFVLSPLFADDEQSFINPPPAGAAFGPLPARSQGVPS